MLHLRGDEVMNDTLPLPFLCTRRARGYKTMRSRLFPGPTERDVLPRLNSSSFQRARLCILPSLAIPRIRLAASLPPQIESFPGSLGLLKAPVTYFWTPDHEAQDTHLTERGAGQSPPGCAWAAPPQQAVAPGRSWGCSRSWHLSASFPPSPVCARHHVRCFTGTIAFQNPYHTDEHFCREGMETQACKTDLGTQWGKERVGPIGKVALTCWHTYTTMCKTDSWWEADT